MKTGQVSRDKSPRPAQLHGGRGEGIGRPEGAECQLDPKICETVIKPLPNSNTDQTLNKQTKEMKGGADK